MNAVFFDFDGVIEDTFELSYGLNNSFNELTRDEYRMYFAGNFYKEYERALGILNDTVAAFFDELAKKLPQLRMKPEIKQILKELSLQYQLHIVTSNSGQILKKYLKNNSAEFFEDILGYEIHLSKVRKFNMLFEKHSPDECIFVTDTLGDLQEAAKVNLSSIAVTWGFHDKKLLQQGKSVAILDNPSEIIPTIKRFLPKTI